MKLETEGTALLPRVIRGAVNVDQGDWPFVSLNSVGINGGMAMTAADARPDISDGRAREFVPAFIECIRWFAGNDRSNP